MSFGLKNALAPSQRIIDIIYSSVKYKFALAYHLDIVIFWQTPSEHISHTRLVCTLLKKAGVRLELKICAIVKNKIDYLRRKSRPSRHEVATHTVEAIRDL